MSNRLIDSIGFRVGVAIAGVLVAAQGTQLVNTARHETRTAVEAEIKAARGLVLMTESVREGMERKWQQGLFSVEMLRNLDYATAEERRAKILAAVPVVSAWEAAKAKAAEGGFEFRTPRENARNKDNTPDAVEAQALRYFEANPQASEYYVVDEARNAVRYFRPVRLGEVCMNCHGDPAKALELWGREDGRDITGFPMDGKKVGDLHGAFEVIRPLDVAQAKVREGMLQGAAFTVAGLALTLILVALLIARMVSGPVRRVRAALASAERDNDISVRLEVNGQGEVAQIAQAFNRFMGRVQVSLEQVAAMSNRLNASAGQLAEATEQTSASTAAQRMETDQVAAAINEMSATAQSVAQNAAEAARATEAASAQAETGHDIVSTTVASIHALAEGVQRTGEAIAALQSDSEAIGRIVDVIRDIAEQTNLLALNAAIEAARAGEQGRGFAVVADEVRTLARRTQESTTEIQSMIEHLQKAARGAVEVTTNGQRQAAQSVEQANRAGESLNAISAAVTTIRDMTHQIASAAEEQTAVAEEIDRNVTRIVELSAEAAAQAERSNGTSHSLVDLSQEMQQLVAAFHIGGKALDLSKAKSAHLAWRTRLRAFLDGKEALTREQATSHQHCVLGKWYYADGLRDFGHIEEMKALEPPHAELHALVREIIELKSAGRIAEAEAAYRRVGPLSERIVRLLDAVERKAGS